MQRWPAMSDRQHVSPLNHAKIEKRVGMYQATPQLVFKISAIFFLFY